MQSFLSINFCVPDAFFQNLDIKSNKKVCADIKNAHKVRKLLYIKIYCAILVNSLLSNIMYYLVELLDKKV